MQIPLGQPAKLIKIFEPNHEDFRITEVANRLKFVQPTPVILLAGAYKARGKTMAGIARAAYNTRSIILDSGMGSEIEKFTMRKGTQLLGICPDAQVSFPKISNKQPNELTNGHTHFFLIGGEEDTVDALEWGQESRIKYDLAQRIAKGRITGMGSSVAPPCKLVTVVVGDNDPSAIRDIEASMNANIPVIVLRGSHLSNNICS